MKNILKNTSKGFTLIELVMVTIILGILAAVAIPRYQQTVDNAEATAEKAFVDMVWAGVEQEASERLTDDGLEAWPYNPLTVIGRSRNISVTLFEGIPDEDNEWQFDGTKLYHRRMNNEIWYFEYNPNTFYLSEYPIKL